MSVLSKNSLAITDFHAKKRSTFNYLKTPFLEPPHSRLPKKGAKNNWPLFCDNLRSETGRIRFRRTWLQTPSSVSFFLALTEFGGENSVSSSWPTIGVPRRAHRVFRRTHLVCRKTQFSSPKQYSRNSIPPVSYSRGTSFPAPFQEVIFGKGMRTATFQFSASGGSLNGPDLFTELPFM